VKAIASRSFFEAPALLHPAKGSPPLIDAIDLKILAALQGEGRLTNQKLADRVGLSASACHARVRRLEKEGYITGYRATLKPELLGRPLTVFALVSLERHGRQGQKAFEAHLTSLPEATECIELSGQYDYLIRFMAKDIESYQALTEALIDDPNLGVAQVVSHVAMRTVRPFQGIPLAE
jgi:DNA-binding Lrp family transcriptional regulator